MSSNNSDAVLLQSVGEAIDNNVSRLAAESLLYGAFLRIPTCPPVSMSSGIFLMLFAYAIVLFW
jgi:hypothetical protein